MSSADELRSRSLLMRILIPPGGRVPAGTVRFRHVDIFGPPESGKTTLALWAASVVEGALDGVDFRCIRAMTVRDALDAVARVEVEPPFYL